MLDGNVPGLVPVEDGPDLSGSHLPQVQFRERGGSERRPVRCERQVPGGRVPALEPARFPAAAQVQQLDEGIRVGDLRVVE